MHRKNAHHTLAHTHTNEWMTPHSAHKRTHGHTSTSASWDFFKHNTQTLPCIQHACTQAHTNIHTHARIHTSVSSLIAEPSRAYISARQSGFFHSPSFSSAPKKIQTWLLSARVYVYECNVYDCMKIGEFDRVMNKEFAYPHTHMYSSIHTQHRINKYMHTYARMQYTPLLSGWSQRMSCRPLRICPLKNLRRCKTTCFRRMSSSKKMKMEFFHNINK